MGPVQFNKSPPPISKEIEGKMIVSNTLLCFDQYNSRTTRRSPPYGRPFQVEKTAEASSNLYYDNFCQKVQGPSSEHESHCELRLWLRGVARENFSFQWFQRPLIYGLQLGTSTCEKDIATLNIDMFELHSTSDKYTEMFELQLYYKFVSTYTYKS